MDLRCGDVIEIMYRMPARLDGDQSLVDRWVIATIVDCEHESWPLARLGDGQLTEIRRFMTWRHVRRAGALDPYPLVA
jgi:hypothetical protein